ncbi:MAG: hypothetical protein ACE37F_13650 [Nannocystaceae bacterium]|nr:cytochrome c [bacterium]
MSLTVTGRPSAGQWLLIVGGLGLLAVGGVGIARFALDWAENHEPGARQMSDRMMEKKSKQLQRVLDGMVAHDYAKVAKATQEIEKISESMEWFVADESFEPDRAAFRDSLHDLQDAVEANNSEAAIRNADKLVDSCLRCHEHLLEDRAHVKASRK